jgi:uncharacterized SAM-binding protein YcdF (DUF218 family)
VTQGPDDPLWSVTAPPATGFASDPLASASPDPTPAAGIFLYPQPTKKRRWWLRLVVAAVLAMFGYYAISLYQVWTTGLSDHRRATEAIVVLGAAQYDGRPSPQLAARLDHAAALHSQELAPIVFATGGKQPGDRFTEAKASQLYLLALGVPESAILLEDTGTSTWESLSNVEAVLREIGASDVILVTDPYHSLRAKLMGEELGLVAHTSATRTSPVSGGEATLRHLREAAGVALGRLLGWGRLVSVTD